MAFDGQGHRWIGVQPSREGLDRAALVGPDVIAVEVEEHPVADFHGQFFLGARSRARNGAALRSGGRLRGAGAAGAAAGRGCRLFGRSGARRQQQGGSEGGNKGKAHNLPSRTHPRSEEHTSELQSLMRISYAVFCLKKKKNNTYNTDMNNSQKKS